MKPEFPRLVPELPVRRCFAALLVAASVSLVAGCGSKTGEEKPASQTAARVNKEEITVHQINFALQQQRGLAPEQAASASKEVLDRLIDQELAVQKAQDQKLDRDPRVLQQIEAARREILARAYVDKIAAGAPKASPEEVKGYYDAHPALFKNRRIYNLQEVTIQASPEQTATLQAKLTSSKDLPDFVAYLKSQDIKYNVGQAVRGAEQLPLASVDKFAQMSDGQTIFTKTPTGAQVVVLAGTKSQPVDEARAAPAIEQFLWNERKRKVVDDDMKALHSAAKIEYVGEYAKGGAREVKPPAVAVPEAPPLTSIAPPTPAASMPGAAPQVEVEPTAVEPTTRPASGVLESGLKGFR